MKPGYIIVGTIWGACTIGLLVAGAAGDVTVYSIAATALFSLFACIFLAPPVAVVAAVLWRLTAFVTRTARIRRRRRHLLRGARQRRFHRSMASPIHSTSSAISTSSA